LVAETAENETAVLTSTEIAVEISVLLTVKARTERPAGQLVQVGIPLQSNGALLQLHHGALIQLLHGALLQPLQFRAAAQVEKEKMSKYRFKKPKFTMTDSIFNPLKGLSGEN
jgi:hypothetical protein